MTADDFRKIALSMLGAVESSHMDHPDFRIMTKIFATLSRGEIEGVVMLSPEQQAEMMRAHPTSFTPAAGAWGLKGSTRVLLAETTVAVAKKAIAMAYANKTTAKPRSAKPVAGKPKTAKPTTAKPITAKPLPNNSRP